ncbi:MAG: hypothetical protein P4L46_09100 [Fimbriimonas sp.]|nr:hypothetical protein [Fimbriimonas sp.]
MSFLKHSAWIVPCICIIVLSSTPTKSSAIPYFARKYRTTCSRCHVAVPKLNTFGKNFQLHGYQQPGDAKAGKIEFPEDKNVTLPENIPIAMMMENGVALDRAAGNQGSNSINSTTVFHIFGADSIAPDIGFFGELANQGGVTDVGKISLIFSHLGNQNIFGQVGNLDMVEHGVTEHDLFARTGYGIQDLGLGALGSPFALSAQRMGVRVYGLIGSDVTPDLIHAKPTGGEPAKPEGAKSEDGRPMALADSQKKGKKGADEDEMDAADPMDSMKGFLWEVGLYNSTNLSSGLATQTVNPGPSDYQARINAYFSGDSFIGIAGYTGLQSVAGIPGVAGPANRYKMFGPDFSYYFGKPFEKVQGVKVKPFNLLGGYLTGEAANPTGAGTSVAFHGYFAELDYAVSPKSMAFIRYDKVDSNNLGAFMPGAIVEGITANYTYYIRTNFWVGAEYTHDLTTTKQDMFGLVFDFAF